MLDDQKKKKVQCRLISKPRGESTIRVLLRLGGWEESQEDGLKTISCPF